MRFSEQFEIAKLYVRKIFNSTNHVENITLKSWRNKHPKVAEDLEKWDKFLQHRDKLAEFDTEKEWKIFLNKKTKKLIFLEQRKRMARIAAMITIPIAAALGTIVYVSHYLEKNTQEIQFTAIPHGERKAELTLSNGQIINLHPKQISKLQELNGTQIKNDSLMLSYQPVTPKTKTSEILYNQLKVDHGKEYFITLSDGTKVWLNSLSSLKYPVAFNGKKRIVELTGEAYFEVAHDKQHPFIVKTIDCNIRVLGTSFNISCYKSDNGVIATLLNGAVNIEKIKGIENKNYKLTPDKQFIYNKNRQNITIKDVDAKMFCSWAKGKFWMDNESLESLMTKMQRWYDINVFFLDEAAKKELFTGILPRFKEFHSLAKMIEQVSNVDIEINNKTVKIKTRN
ncbi:FecR family protein [Prolixibacteraceae bacterium JC049]|nr:FecR family protein [Prolixibacteraceae bacterium JC049]